MSRGRPLLGVVLLVFLAHTDRVDGARRASDPSPTDPSSSDAARSRLDRIGLDLLEGRIAAAKTAFDALETRPTMPAQSDHTYTDQYQDALRRFFHWSLTKAILEPEGADPYALLIDIIEKCDDGLSGNDSPLGIWDRLLARYAVKERYPAIARFTLDRATRLAEYTMESKYRSRAERDAASQRHARLLSEASTIGNAIQEGGTGPGTGSLETDAMSSTIRRLLETPRIVPFVEVPLPRIKDMGPHGAAPLDADAIDPDAADADAGDADASEPGASDPDADHDPDAGPAPDALAGLAFPESFEPVRIDRRGTDVAAIGLSQDYDPVGEVSRGAYWLLLSHDGGANWQPPLYTGLRIQAPYVVHATSRVPMLDGDHLDVEVSVRELDEDSITFPPVALRAKRSKDGLMLVLRVDDLARDRDADGLTDLAEERLITDPDNPDTDGDGLPDATDPLPQVAWAGTPTPSAAALGKVLEEIAGMKSMAIIHEIAPAGAKLDDFMAGMKRASLTSQDTTFFAGQRTDFAPLLTDRRAVVLTATEFELVRRKFGVLYPLELALFVIDHDGRRGHVIWTASWVGGSFTLELVDGVWRSRTVSQWIT